MGSGPRKLAGMVTVSEFRVRYAETDQMGVAYHANYLVWCEVGRTDFIRELGVTYAEMEKSGVLLAVADAQVRFHSSARYDDLVSVRTRLTSVRSRMVTFSYEVVGEDGGRLASATTTLVSLDPGSRPIAIPERFRNMLAGAVSE